MQENLSKVNFKKLVRNLADMYHDDTFDVVLTELIANALDAKASKISVSWDRKQHILIVVDDGKGMDSEAFKQYHDFAAELKTRGNSIGFAGVGAKISFNIADRVVTETRRDGVVNASDWRWHNDGSLRWHPIQSNQPPIDGTCVKVYFKHDQVLPDVDTEYLVGVLKRHYLPLFITEFVRAYSAINIYPTCPQFIVNDLSISQDKLADTAALDHHDNFKHKGGWGAIGVSKRDCPVGDNAYGVLLCTHGKVIKPELFGLSTGALGTKLFGIVEIPGLIEYLTTNKCDLKGVPGRSQGLNKCLDPVREELKKFLAAHGVAMVEQRQNPLSAKLERELTKMVGRLPELQDFDGLLRKSRALRKGDDGNILTSEIKTQGGDENSDKANDSNPNNNNGGESRQLDKDGKTRAKRQRSRKNQGPRVAFEEHPNRGETAWLDSNTVIINSGHVAYRKRTTQDQARLTYCMFAIGVALDKANLVPDDNTSYVDKFISAWGQS